MCNPDFVLYIRGFSFTAKTLAETLGKANPEAIAQVLHHFEEAIRARAASEHEKKNYPLSGQLIVVPQHIRKVTEAFSRMAQN